MRKQLAPSTDLINAIRIIDQDYFGDRFFDEQGDRAFFSDLATARKVVDAVAEELSGAGAFVDSPVLRDGIHNLVTALESLRTRSLELERKGLDAIGLPGETALPAAAFPDQTHWLA